jgi:hypothetical protein
MSVNFGDLVAAAEHVSPRALEIGTRFADTIPDPAMDGTGLRDAARWWAEWVGKIVPLFPGAHPKAKEANSDVLGRDWNVEDVASNDPATVWDWWSEAPFSNIGFCSRANGILIIDLDPRHGGLDKWRALCTRYDMDDLEVPRSVSPTGDGGQHLWFKVPPGETFAHSPLMHGIDRPWQVPVQPSLRIVTVDPSAKDPARRLGLRPYRWLSGDPRALPTAPPVLLGDALESTQTGSAPDAASNPASSTVGGGLDDVTAVPVGVQSYTFKRLACSLVRRGKSDEEIAAALWDVALASPVGDANDPWQPTHMVEFAHGARRYIERQDAEAARRASAAIAGIQRSILS